MFRVIFGNGSQIEPVKREKVSGKELKISEAGRALGISDEEGLRRSALLLVARSVQAN